MCDSDALREVMKDIEQIGEGTVSLQEKLNQLAQDKKICGDIAYILNSELFSAVVTVANVQDALELFLKQKELLAHVSKARHN